MKGPGEEANPKTAKTTDFNSGAVAPRARYYLDLITVLTQKEMKVRYKSSFLGYLWSVANPLAFALVYWIAFKLIMRIQMKDYTLFLIAGLFPWQWFSNSVNASTTVFIGNSSIIKKVNFPRNAVPFALVLQDMIHFVLSIPVIVFFLLLYHKTPSLAWAAGLPVLLAIQLLITYGFSLMLSSVNLFFRDMERLVSILIAFIFYFTPVVYNADMVPARFRHLIELNPLAPIMMSWRDLFLEGRLDLRYILIGFAYAFLFYLLGLAIYKKLSCKFAEIL